MSKVYNCDICKKVSYRIDYHKAHIARIHPQDKSVKSKLFKCDYCESYFKNIKNRSHHLTSYCRHLPSNSFQNIECANDSTDDVVCARVTNSNSKVEGEVKKRTLLDVALEQSEIILDQLSPVDNGDSKTNHDKASDVNCVLANKGIQGIKADSRKESLLDFALEQSDINFNESVPALEKDETILTSAPGTDKILIDSTNSNEFLEPSTVKVEKLLDLGKLKITKGYKTRYFHCPVCDASIRRLPRLVKHILDMHPVNDTFKCPICNKSFRRQNELKKHAKEEHKINCLHISNKDLDEYLRSYHTAPSRCAFIRSKNMLKKSSGKTTDSKKSSIRKLSKFSNPDIKESRVPHNIDVYSKSNNTALNRPTSTPNIDNEIYFNFDDIAENYIVLSATPKYEEKLSLEDFNFHKGKSMPLLNSPFNNSECVKAVEGKNMGDSNYYQVEDTSKVNFSKNNATFITETSSNNVNINITSVSPSNYITLHSAKKNLSLNVELHPNKLRSCRIPNIGKFEVLGSPMENLLKEYTDVSSTHVENNSSVEGHLNIHNKGDRETRTRVGDSDMLITKNTDSDEDSLLPDDVSLASVDESDVASVDIEISALFRNHNSISRCSDTYSQRGKCSPSKVEKLREVTNNEFSANSLIRDVDVQIQTTSELSNIAIANEIPSNEICSTEDTADILNTTQQVVDIVFDLETDSENVTIDNSYTSNIHSNLNSEGNPVNAAIDGYFLLDTECNMNAIENSYKNPNYSNFNSKDMTTDNEFEDSSNICKQNDYKEQEALDSLSLVSFSDFPLTNHDPNLSIGDIDLDNICENQETLCLKSDSQTDSKYSQLQHTRKSLSDILENAIPEASISKLDTRIENCIFKRPKLPRIQILSNVCIKKSSSNLMEYPMQVCENTIERLNLTSNKQFQKNKNEKFKKKICTNLKSCEQSKIRLLLRKHGLLMQYRCAFCSKLFKTPNVLRNHILSHDEHKALICYVCGLQTLSKQNMRAHIFNKHLLVDGINFGKIPKNWTLSFDFNRRLKALYCYECTLCKLKLHKQADVITHVDSDECQKRIFYMCEICGQCLGNTMSFNRHRQQFHGSSVKKRYEEPLLSEVYGPKSLTNKLEDAIKQTNFEKNIDNQIEQVHSDSKKVIAPIGDTCDHQIDQSDVTEDLQTFDIDDFFVKPHISNIERKQADVLNTPTSFEQNINSSNATVKVSQTKADDYPIVPDVQFPPSKISRVVNSNNRSKHTENQDIENNANIYVESKILEKLTGKSIIDCVYTNATSCNAANNDQKLLENREESTFSTERMPVDYHSEVSLKVQKSSKSCQESFERFIKSKTLDDSFSTKSNSPYSQINMKGSSTNVNSSSSEIGTSVNSDLVHFNQESLKRSKHIEMVNIEETSTDVATTTLSINEVIQKEFPNESEKLPDLDDILAKAVSMRNIRYKTTNFEFKCNYCVANFRNKMSLWNHTKHKHKNKQHYKCIKCAKTFEYERSLKDHMKLKHSQLNTTKCYMCFKELHISSYRGHMRVHTNHKSYSCPVCAMKFKHPSSRKNHFIKVHIEGKVEKIENTDLKSMLESFTEDIYS